MTYCELVLYEVWGSVKKDFLAYEYTIALALFVERTILSSLNYICIFVQKDWPYCFGLILDCLLCHSSMCRLPIWYSLDYYSHIMSLWQVECFLLFYLYFSELLYSNSSAFPWKFRIIFTISTKNLARILMRIALSLFWEV